MFSTEEASFLFKELTTFIDKVKTHLEKPDVEGQARLNIEAKLITANACLTKIRKSQQSREEYLASINRPLKALVVDDVKSMREVNRQLLMAMGFKKVDTAEDGAEALTILQQAATNESHYNLVLSDWEMPKMSGIELLKALRISDTLYETPVFLLTSMSEKKHILEAINNGANGYLVKPVNQKMMQQKLKAFLPT